MLNKIRASVRTGLRRALLARGYSLERTAPLDARWNGESPRELVLKRGAVSNRSILMNVPIARCRSSIGSGIDSQHPFVAAIAGGVDDSVSKPTLQAYYQQCQPASAIEVLGVSEGQAPGLSGFSAHAFVMPWNHRDPGDMLDVRDGYVREDIGRYSTELGIEHGWHMFGPVSEERSIIECNRLRELVKSIKNNGFIRHDGVDGDIRGRLFTEEGGDWCIVVGRGQHRIAVVKALGMVSVPVRIGHIPVKREEVMYWPQVAEGRITPEGALAVFDRTMRGDPPLACQFKPPAPVAPRVAHNHESIEVVS